MGHSTTMEHIRRTILESLRQFGAAGEDYQETILIRNGFYCGRRFACDGLEAVWFAEENQVKFFGRDGSLIETRSMSTPAARRDVA